MFGDVSLDRVVIDKPPVTIIQLVSCQVSIHSADDIGMQ